MAEYTESKTPTEGDYNCEQDAEVLKTADEIKSDTDRHTAAVQHLAKSAQSAKSAHKSARKELEKRTKGRIAKAFGEIPDVASAPQVNQKDFGTSKQ